MMTQLNVLNIPQRLIRLWDPRVQEALVGLYMQSLKVYSLDISQNKLDIYPWLIVMYIYDIRNMKEMQTRESSLKHMTRSIRCMPNGEGM
ncbi:mitotic spindle checkpoint protein Bub3 [Basidiobolus ranarum]|uniref:Mitotic spindle checkpoint protein Bub3 n=1 Tax=Basidiobolus ranarum TaxID=34480 RepID=A0ABR2VZJ1_9FUNG